MIAAGIDAGSTTCKVVALDDAGAVVARLIEPASPRIDEQAARMLAAVGGDRVGATGYGRKRVPSGLQVTEITCHARGAFAQTRRAGLLVDMGGQDTKVIRVGGHGEVLDFAMNDKCAAGTGRFLEVILQRLGVGYDRVAAFGGPPVAISSTCTVFAESEVISLVANGEPLGGIVRGIHAALAARVSALARPREGEEVWMSGGVALNAAMVAALSERLGRLVRVLEDPQFVGAVGAALAAR